MKKVLSLLIVITLLLGSMAIPVAAVSSDSDNILWEATTADGLTEGVTLKADKTSIEQGEFMTGSIKDVADWNGAYDMIGALLPEPITNKVVSLSFDFYPESVAWGAPSFRVDVFEGNDAYIEDASRSDWFLGFFAYDAPGQNDHAKVEGAYPEYYDESTSFFTYYGGENANSEPYDKTAGEWVNEKAKIAFRKVQHIDCVYDLQNKTVTHYVDGVKLGTSAGPSKIGALAFRKKNYVSGKTVYYGVMRLENIKLTEVKEGSLSWETETEVGADSFLLNFSEPVNTLAKGMITLTDMETLATSKPASTEKITPYQWRVNIDGAKPNAEYKVEITALTSIFGGTPKTETGFAYTQAEQSFGVKKVRYDAVLSNKTKTVAASHSDDFSGYTTAADPGLNKENTNDYAVMSNGMWSRNGHTQTSSWWGQGTYVNNFGQLSIDAYSNTNSIAVGAVRQMSEDGSAVTGEVLNVDFDMAYYVAERHDGSSFTLYAGDYPIFGADRESVYLYDEQLVDEKILLGDNTFTKANYANDLKHVGLTFDFENKEIRINFAGMIKTTSMYDELAEGGIANLKFTVNLLNGIEGGNGDYRGNALVLDNYSDEVLAYVDEPLYLEGVNATEVLKPTTSKIQVTFSDAMARETIDGIAITDENGDPVNYVPSWTDSDKTLTLEVALKPETKYTLQVSTGVASAGETANGREYIYTFATDKAVKFFDADGKQIAEDNLATTNFANVEILVNAPEGNGKFAYLYAIYDKADDMLKDVRVQEISYTDGDVIAYDDAVMISDDEYAKVFLWETLNTVTPMGGNYSFGK